jgi:hypothetical protein
MLAMLLASLLCTEIPTTTLTVRGAWVLDREGKPVPPGDWTRGLQTSGIACVDGALVAVGDQRSSLPAHLFTIGAPAASAEAPREVRMLEAPVPIVPGPGLPDAPLRQYLSKRNPDFEDLVADPTRPGVFFAVIEQDGMLVLEITHPAKSPQATITGIAEIDAPGYAPWRDDWNYRMEGLAIVGPGPELILAFERAADNLPRLYKTTWKKDTPRLPATLLPVPFDKLPPRPGKGLLNVNAIAAHARGAEKFLLLLARDHERIVVLDLGTLAFVRIVELDFRGPDMEKLLWTSPEGLAIDAKAGVVYMITDPDSERGNYRAEATTEAAGNYAAMAPLLFAVPLAKILPEPPPAAE